MDEKVYVTSGGTLQKWMQMRKLAMGYEQIKLKQKNAAPGARRFKARSQSLITPLQSPIMQQYRNLGNQAIQRMMESRTIQAKLKIGQPNDKYEQEADRVADQVMRMPEPKQSLVNGHSSLIQRESTRPECREDMEGIQAKPITQQITPIIQRQSGTEEEEKPLWCEPKKEEEPPMCTEEEEKELIPEPTLDSTDIESIETGDAAAGPIDISEEEELHRKKQDGGNVNNPGPGLQNQIHSLKGGGHILPKSVRSYFEPRFGVDFSRVRVHNDSQAAHAARSLNARAFTIGRDIIFAAGQYSPGSLTGKKLMAHELAHVMQQTSPGEWGPTCASASSAPPSIQCDLKPPGNCIKGIHDEMQRLVDAWCKHPSGSTCTPRDSCHRLRQKIRRNQLCAQHRRAINDKCYNGGDRGHRIAERDARRAQKRCMVLWRPKCKPPPPMSPVPVRQPKPVRAPHRYPLRHPVSRYRYPRPSPASRVRGPVMSKGFLDKMSEITGLTGVALILYLIISEGSRIIFPPRNLVPVP